MMAEWNAAIVNDPRIQNLMHSDIKFDVMLSETAGADVLVGFAHVFKVPVIGISTVRSSFFVQRWTGTPVPPSYLPFVLSRFRGEMTFLERVENTVFQNLVEMVMCYMGYFGDVSILSDSLRELE